MTKELPTLMYFGSKNEVMIQHNGTMQTISPLALRKRCRSPSNRVDELPADLVPVEILPMGNYAVFVRWSDGHQSLLPYESFIDGY